MDDASPRFLPAVPRPGCARRRLSRLALAWAVAAYCCLASVARAEPGPHSAENATHCQAVKVWSVSTHGLTPCCDDDDHPASGGASVCLRVERWEACNRWQAAEMADLVASDACAAPTCIYIHGYNNSQADAREGGLAVYRALAADGSDAERLRVIVWMWPSERSSESPLEGFRTVANVAEHQAMHLAEFLAKLPHTGDMVLWGHSYGARLATGALHLLGGGELLGTTLPETPAGLCCLRAVLTAAALDDDWLLPGQRHGCALSITRRILVLASPSDPVLRRYAWTRPGESPQALGSTGMKSALLSSADAAKVRQVNVSGLIGVAHVSKRYLRSFGVVDMIRAEVLREQAVPPPRWTGNAVGRSRPSSAPR